MKKEEIKKRLREKVDKRFEGYKNREVMLKGGQKGIIVGWQEADGLSYIRSFKVKIGNKIYEVRNNNIIAVELDKGW